MTSRREVVQAIGVGAAALPVLADAVSANPPPAQIETSVGGPDRSAATEAFLAQFETAWRPLDPQLPFVLRLIYARPQGLPPPVSRHPPLASLSTASWVGRGGRARSAPLRLR
jgi:hypothetical protein